MPGKQARVLIYEGTPIPRLYAIGESGCILGFLYSGVGNVAECPALILPDVTDPELIKKTRDELLPNRR